MQKLQKGYVTELVKSWFVCKMCASSVENAVVTGHGVNSGHYSEK